jgi:hypothetical protein
MSDPLSMPIEEIIQSSAAGRMLDSVTEGFYDRSRTALWMFEVMGREWDEVEDFSDNLPLERFPHTCTWSIAIWEYLYDIPPDESLSLEQRRARIMYQRQNQPPINPARIEAMLSQVVGVPITVDEFLGPYRFGVTADGGENHRNAIRVLRVIKPSHLSFAYFAAHLYRFITRLPGPSGTVTKTFPFLWGADATWGDARTWGGTYDVKEDL